MAGSEKALEIVDRWKHGWMRQEDYRMRAMSVDSNMRHSLATMIDEALQDAITQERIRCSGIVSEFKRDWFRPWREQLLELIRAED